MMKSILFTCISLVCGIHNLNAQTDHLIDIQVSCPDQAKAGDSITIRVNFNVKDGWHVYAPLDINENQGLSVTRLQILDLPDKVLGFGATSFSQPRSYASYSVFEGKDNFLEQKFCINQKFQGDTLFIKGEFQYQACDARKCLPPEAVPFEKTIVIRKTDKMQNQERTTSFF